MGQSQRKSSRSADSASEETVYVHGIGSVNKEAWEARQRRNAEAAANRNRKKSERWSLMSWVDTLISLYIANLRILEISDV